MEITLFFSIFFIIISIIIYQFIITYNKGGPDRAIILDTIAFSVIILLYPFMCLYHYITHMFKNIKLYIMASCENETSIDADTIVK